MMPPASATQLIASAGAAASSDSAKAHSRSPIHLPPALAVFVSLEVMHAPRPLTGRSPRQWDRGSPCCGLDSGSPAVSWPCGPVRPVTLRRHLSMALPLSESRRDQVIRFAVPPNLLGIRAIPLRLPASHRRQKVDRVHNRQGLHALLRAEIDRPDPGHDLS